MKQRGVHKLKLDELVHNLGLIGENKDQVSIMIKELMWKEENGCYKPMCDLLLVHHPVFGSGHAVELKASSKYRHHAVEQLDSGCDYLHHFFNIHPSLIVRTIVYYGGGWSYENV